MGRNGSQTAAAIRRVGLGLIYRHGFEAMTLRELAAEVGVQAASLYNHIRNKQDLLFELIREHMAALSAETDAALASSPAGATERLKAFVAHHVTYHLERRQEVFVANFELRALDAEHRAVIVEMRRLYEERLVMLLRAGAAADEFDIGDPQITAYAILAMLTGACTWYRPDGRLTRAEIVRFHTNLVLHGCRSGARDSADPFACSAPSSMSETELIGTNPEIAEAGN